MAATEARTARYLPPEEVVAALTLAALPVVGYVLALFTAAFHGRYVLQAVLGVAILVGWGAATLVTTSRNTAILVAVLILCVSGRLAGGALGLVRDPLDPLAEHRPLISVPRGDSPLVISHALDFLPIAHYSSSGGPAVLYLTEPSNQGRGATTAHRAMRLLTRYAPLDVRDFDAFVASHPHFFLYGRSSWVVRTLRSRGATLQFLGQNDTATLYAVDLAR